jgi:hypothetical protein
MVATRRTLSGGTRGVIACVQLGALIPPNTFTSPGASPLGPDEPPECRGLALPAPVLSPGFPNPFARATTTDYHVPASGRVVLEVFDGLGRLVATIVDEHQPAGQQSVTWAPGELASGVYYVRLATGKETAAKHILLLR